MGKKHYAYTLEEELVKAIPLENKSKFVEMCLRLGLSEYEKLKQEATSTTFQRICNATIDDRELATRFEEYPGQVKS